MRILISLWIRLRYGIHNLKTFFIIVTIIKTKVIIVTIIIIVLNFIPEKNNIRTVANPANNK